MDENGPNRPFSSNSGAGGAVKVVDFRERETRFYPESKRIKIAASEADFEAGELWGIFFQSQ